MNRFENRVVIVTGAGRGMGRAHALGFAEQGASVVVVDRVEESAAAVAAELPSAIAVVADLVQTEDTLRMAAEAIEAFGRIDVLVNNAGGAVTPPQPVVDETEENWDRLIDLNLKSQWLCVRAVLPAMRSQGSGKIVNIASVAGINGTLGRSAYGAAKSGVVGLTRVLARELGPDGITANAVAPGLIKIDEPKTAYTSTQFERMVESAMARQQVKRLGRPRDVTGAVLYFASSDADFVTGQVLVVDGGGTLGATMA